MFHTSKAITLFNPLPYLRNVDQAVQKHCLLLCFKVCRSSLFVFVWGLFGRGEGGCVWVFFLGGGCFDLLWGCFLFACLQRREGGREGDVRERERETVQHLSG